MSSTVGFCPKNLDPDVPENWSYIPVEDGGMELGKNWLPSMEPRINYETKLTFKREFVVGGRGHGKSERARRAYMGLEESSEPLLTKESLQKAFEDGRKTLVRYPYALPAWQYEMLENLGHDMQFIQKLMLPTPREELRERLMIKLRGDDPGTPINWKGLK